MLGDVSPAIAERNKPVRGRRVVAVLVPPALLVGVTSLAVEFHDNSVPPVAGVPVDRMSVLHAAGLPLRCRQAMSALHIPQVPVLEHGLHAIGDILEGKLNLGAPASLGPHLETLGQQEWRRKTSLAGSGQQSDNVVETGRSLSEVEHRLLHQGARREQPVMARFEHPR
jgi:hypothetical protein